MIGKLFNLLKLFFTNHNKYCYFIKHYKNSIVGDKKSKLICEKNNNDYQSIGINRFEISTYDFSNQYTHPDCVLFGGKYWLVLTPYPYGMEAYENPCLYYSNDFLNIKEFYNNPIANQGVVKRGNHLSDPFFCIDDNRLIVLYRKNEIADGKEVVTIYYRFINGSYELSKEKTLVSGSEDFLSPILFKKDDKYYFQYMNKTNNGSEIKEIIFDKNFVTVQTNGVLSENFPEGFSFWHFGIEHEESKKSVTGLILLRHNSIDHKFELCTGKYFIKDKKWVFENKVNIPLEIEKNMAHLYKSCFVPNKDEILLSYKDKKGRYYCSLIQHK